MAFFYCSKSESQGTPSLEALRSFVAQLALSPDGLSVDESVKRLVERPMSSELSLEQCSKQSLTKALRASVSPHGIIWKMWRLTVLYIRERPQTPL